MCVERFPTFTTRGDLALERDYCDSIRPCKPSPQKECQLRFPMSHSMKYLRKKYDKLRSNYEICNFSILHFARSTYTCYDDMKIAKAKLAKTAKNCNEPVSNELEKSSKKRSESVYLRPSTMEGFTKMLKNMYLE